MADDKLFRLEIISPDRVFYQGDAAMVEMCIRDREITEYAVREQGMKTLKESAVERVKLGITTVDELLKVAYYS